MTTALFIFYTDTWQTLADLVLPVAARYCERHGYAKEFICEELKPVAASNNYYNPDTSSHAPIGYYKMVKLRELMDKYELIWVLDADCLITNEAISFHDYCEDPNKQNIFFCEDSNGINAGSFIIRGKCYETNEWIDTIINNFDAPEEQSVMKRFLKYITVYRLPHPSINSYLYTEYLNDWDDKVGRGKPMPSHEQGFWKPGDFVLHLPGLSLQRRIEIFKQIIEQL